MKRIFFLVTLLSIVISACAKQPISVGGGAPEDEIKKCVKLMEAKDYEDAIQCLEMFKARYSHSPLAQEAELEIGDAYYDKKEYLLAAESYLAFLKLYPTHPKADYAHYRVGASYLKASPKAIDRDQEYIVTAIDHLRFVLRRYPTSAYVSLASRDLHEARLRVAKREFYIARFYYRTGEYIACIPRFQTIVDVYEDSGLVDKSLYLMTVANLKLDRLSEARDSFSKLALEYPDSKYLSKAEKHMNKAINKQKD